MIFYKKMGKKRRNRFRLVGLAREKTLFDRVYSILTPMKKLYFFMFLTLLLVSCGDDDSSAAASDDFEEYSETDENSSSSEADDSSSSLTRESSSGTKDASSSSLTSKSSSSGNEASSSSVTNKSSSSSVSSGDTSSSSVSSSSSSSGNNSSSSVPSSSSSSEKKTLNTLLKTKGEQFNANFAYGTMTDPRDGKTYRTTELNGQTWMAENLNFAGNKVGKSFCYDNDEDICEIYGRLYTREAAMNSASCGTSDQCNLGAGPIQGICPDEWHIPSVAEINALWDELDSTVNSWVSSKGWAIDRAGGDSYGLSFIPAGMGSAQGFQHLDSIASMWLYSPNGSQNYLVLNSETDKVFISDFSSYASVSVRCVKGEAVLPSSSSYSSSSSSSTEPLSSGASSSSSFDYYSIIEKNGDQFSPVADYGTMTDTRDGQTYKTVEIDGRVWMAENLNFVGNEDFPIVKEYSLCYNESDEACELFGRLYSREAAMNSDTCGYNTNCSLDDPLQGACPDGWHIPSLSEAEYLRDLPYGTLASMTGWHVPGDDTYGLSFLPTGNKRGDKFNNIGSSAFMWVNTPGAKQRYFVVNGNDEKRVFIHQGINDTALYLSIRCIKD